MKCEEVLGGFPKEVFYGIIYLCIYYFVFNVFCCKLSMHHSITIKAKIYKNVLLACCWGNQTSNIVVVCVALLFLKAEKTVNCRA
jgi:hypothetical protein